MAERDVLVVGAGVFGAAVACELARHGWGPRVRVLERLQP
ncbi:FAD-dependent oxidoreductase, partial [Rubrivivax gelatinosus]